MLKKWENVPINFDPAGSESAQNVYSSRLFLVTRSTKNYEHSSAIF